MSIAMFGAVRVASFPAECIVRTARKPWRCWCANPIDAFEVRRHCEHGWSGGSVATVEEVAAWRDRVSGTPCHGGKLPAAERLEVIERVNPNYRSDCLRLIEPGDTYVEYVGEAFAYEHGISYCARCALEVWALPRETAVRGSTAAE